MKESNNFTDNVTIKQLQREILFDYKVQYIKVSSSHAGNVTITQGKSGLLKRILESKTFTGNVTIKQL